MYEAQNETPWKIAEVIGESSQPFNAFPEDKDDLFLFLVLKTYQKYFRMYFIIDITCYHSD